MPARDTHHGIVKTALIKDGWKITHDPYWMKWKGRNLYIDLGAELLAAQKGNHKIAVEIKSFIGQSTVNDLENALGQYMFYHDILSIKNPKRILYLAVSQEIWDTIFSREMIGEILLQKKRLKLLVFELSTKKVIQWITP